jgi:formylglycine-generating enzyme required for sulfatase activity
MIAAGTLLRNRYKIVKLLGSGGFGDTYLAQDQDLPGSPLCVVKHLKPKDPNPNVLPVARRLFNAEAEVLYKLGNSSDRIPRLFAHFEENGEFYLVQEYIAGHDLTKELIPGKRLSESYVIKLLQDILEILVDVHRQNIIHRDINPKNVMRRKEDSKLMLIDFGAVKEIGTLSVHAQGKTRLSVIVGTPGYMPSEQAKGKPKPSSDVYAVGMIGIQALTGIMPDQLPEDNDGEVIWKNRASVSNGLANILSKMVRDHFPQRYTNATEALQALNALISTPAVPTVSFISASLKAPTPTLPTSPFQFTTVRVNDQGEIVSQQGQAEVFIEKLGNNVILEMVSIPGGKFLMGSPDTGKAQNSTESPQHWVTVPPFFLGKYPITQAQWQAVMGNNPSYFKGNNRPVEKVSWNDAIEFCQKLSLKMGRCYRLPSEAEWEYACRAGTSTPFHFGETITPDLANYDGTYTYASGPRGQYREQTTDVGSFPPNAFGLYDMPGNIWEWCQDVWHENYNGATSDGSAWESGGNSKYRLLRGGSWYNLPRYCHSAYRYGDDRGSRYNYIGFRVVLPPAFF